MQSAITSCLGVLIVLAGWIVPPLNAQIFRNPVRIPTSQDPSSLYLADVNGDGVPDFIFEVAGVYPGPESIQTMFSQPGGGYAAGPTLVLPPDTNGCRTLDANRDGKFDLVCITQIDDFDVEVVTFLGNGDGTFQTPIYSAPMQSNVGLGNGFNGQINTVGDVNSDGIPDVLVGDDLDQWVFVLLGDGTGKFTFAPTLQQNILEEAYSNLSLVDLNGDGKPDLFSSNGPSVWLGNGDGTFKAGANFGLWESCILNDMDADGRLDAICGAFVTDSGISAGDATGATELAILHGNGDGTFNRTPIATRTFGTPTGGYGDFLAPAAVVDVNGDGILDILGFSSDGFTVLMGQGGLAYADPVHYALGFPAGSMLPSFQFVDFDKDGHIDVVSSGPKGIYISYGKKDGTFSTAPAYKVAQVVSHITVADFNGDGIPDVAATGDQSIELSLGNGDGTFKPFVPLANGGIDFSTSGLNYGAAVILHGDFKGNGKQDILAVGASSSTQHNAYIYFGGGDGTFTGPQLVPGSNPIISDQDPVSVYDVNKDGRDDILTKGSTGIQVSLSNGDGSFTTVLTPVWPSSNFESPTPVALADFNHDGKLDAVYGEGTNVFVLNGHADGTFDTSGPVLAIPPYRGVEIPFALAVATGDFDGDGNTDIAIVARVGGNFGPPGTDHIVAAVYVYYGNGDGTFTAPVIAGGFNRVYTEIRAADLNRDGLCDIILQTTGIIGPATGDSIGAVLSAPGRVFGPEVNYTGGQIESGLFVADLNGDGYPDLLASNGGYFPNGDYITAPGNSVTELLNLGSQSAVGALPSTTTLTSTNKQIPANTSVVFTATVAGSGVAPTGTVRFADQAGIETTVALTPVNASSARATLTTDTLGYGSDVVSSSYSGDENYAPSAATLTETVTGVPSSLSLSIRPNPVVSSNPAVNLTVTVNNPPGSSAPLPTGFVVFLQGSTVLAVPTQLTNGTAAFNWSLVNPGLTTFSAQYSGDIVHLPSTAAISDTLLMAPMVGVFPPTLPPTIAQAFSVGVQVTEEPSSLPVPTGTVILAGNGYTSAPASLSNGSATFNLTAGSLPIGMDRLTATYTPDSAASSIFATSSGAQNIQIAPIPATYIVTATSLTVSPGAVTGNTSTITVTPSGGFTGNVTLTATIASSPVGSVDAPTLSFGSTSPVIITGVSSGSAVLTVTTTAPTAAALDLKKGQRRIGAGAGLVVLACLILFGTPTRRREWPDRLGAALLLVALASFVSACGGGRGGGTGGSGGGGQGNPGTTPGTYAITVTATSGSVTSSGAVALTVQ